MAVVPKPPARRDAGARAGRRHALGGAPRRNTGTRRFAQWSVRTKLAVVALVPLIVVGVLSGLRIAGELAQQAALNRTIQAVEAQNQASRLLDVLATERLQAATYVALGRRSSDTAYSGAIAATDRVAPGVEKTLAALALPGSTATQRAQLSQALSQLPDLRVQVDTSQMSADAAIDRYNGTVAPLLSLIAAVGRTMDHERLIGLASARSAAEAARDLASLQSAQLTAAVLAGPRRKPDLAALQKSDIELDTAIGQIEAPFVSADDRYAAVVTSPANAARKALVDTVLAEPSGRRMRAQVTSTMTDEIAVIDEARADLRANLGAVAGQLSAQARRALVINIVVVLLTLLLVLALVYFISRSMVRNLDALRVTALDVADHRLPTVVRRMRIGEQPDLEVTPVPVTSRDEIGEVARAFDQVHGQAVRLASEQVQLQENVNSMFVNLSRRSQTLVDRQLQIIEGMEQREDDAEALATLFRLDHLATRMRRNSENLMVLAGARALTRTMDAVPLVDVLQASISEVESYERVLIQAQPAVAIVGRAASDVVHLLAELLDNACAYSPPETQVVLSATITADGDLECRVADWGLGMRDADLTQVNTRLAGRPEVDVSVARRMGLFVVGRLAATHGITVRLTPSGGAAPRIGVTAVIVLPATLLTSVTSTRVPANAAAAAYPISPDYAATPDSSAPGGSAARPSLLPPSAAPGALFEAPVAVTHPPVPAPEPSSSASEASDLAAAPGPDAGVSPDDSTPIFDELASAWYQTAEWVPRAWLGDRAETDDADEPAIRPTRRRHELPEPESVAFATSSDAGWQAAATAERHVPEQLTSAGLPKRRRGAQLVPGVADAGSAEPRRVLDAAAVQRRLAGYQQGLRNGRRVSGRLATELAGVSYAPFESAPEREVAHDDR